MNDRTCTGVPLHFSFVLGMHRSGSSALARVLNLAGLRISSQLLPPNQDNPSGYWEPQRVVRFNDALLAESDRHWADPKPMPPGWATRELPGHGFAEAADLLRSEAAQATGPGSGMVVKDPRLSRLMPFWREALAHHDMTVHCLIVCRHPLDVAQSLYARDRVPLDQALALWLAYMLEAEAGTREMNRVLVHYEDLLADWAMTLETIGRNNADMDVAAINGFLDEGLRHHNASAAWFLSDDPLHCQVQAAYEAFRAEDALERTQTFERINDERIRYWESRSPGPEGSGITKDMPAWYAEQSWKYVAVGDYAKVLAELDIAISLAPDVARFSHLRGNALGQLGRLSEAVDAHRQAIKLAPAVPRFHRALCDCLERAGRFEEAAEALGMLAALSPDGPTHHQHGLWLARIGCHAEAAAAQQEAIALDATRPSYHSALADALTHLNQRDAACEALSRAIDFQPADAWLLDRLGDLEAGADRWPLAVEAYEKAVQLRCQMLGFRGDAPQPEPKLTDAKGHLLGLLSRLTARHWADDLTHRLAQAAPVPIDSAQAWPQGGLVQHRPRVPLPEGANRIEGCGPLLSVMIPVYHVARAPWLRRCLESVLQQDRGPDWAEIVVVDDASPDDAAERICNGFDGRVRYLRNPCNLGLIGNHNHCLAIARGTFVHILHQDDFVEPGFYDALLAPLERDERLVAGFSHNRFIDGDDRVHATIDPPRPPRGVLHNWHVRLSLELRIQFPSIIVRRSAYHQVGGFFPARRFSFDWDLWNRVAHAGPVWYEPRPLAMYRIHPSSATYTFSLVDRVVDAMQTVAAMVQVLPVQHCRSTAEMGMYKFLRRYWGLATDVPEADRDPERAALMALLLQGWASEGEARRVCDLLRAMG
jgi:GT2 family glycosyltransferase/tetratricopeptide (TPR) repeat protein